MLKDTDTLATIAVSNLAKARKFYEGTLGFEPVGTHDDQVVIYRSGSSRFQVYESDFAGTNEATAATWFAGDDVDKIAKALKTKGVKFEHYDFPDTELEGDVHVMGEMRNAWFKDPDGNILSVCNGVPVEAHAHSGSGSRKSSK